MIEHDEIEPGYYKWRLNQHVDAEIVKVVQDDHGLHMRSINRMFTECIYGEFLARIEL